MKAMKMICTGAMALGLCATGVLAQGSPANSAEAGAKVAAINMRAAIANTSEGKQAAAQLETQFAARRRELEDLNKKIDDLRQRLTAGTVTLSDEEKQKLTVEGQRLTRQLERRQNEFQEDLNDAQSDVISRIGRRMVEVLGKYAPSKGYAAVLDNSSQSTPVMYASADITQEVVKAYDVAYPLSGGAADGKTTAKPSGR
ncbi:MAG TPA: OmpH family outer membrane protein [Candidatus Acidoferrum sp.]|nr:OmpH family outer membrane protein [Candidatus Acidoferrum sp.]